MVVLIVFRRIVLLPALMLLLGDRVWWLPRPLARTMPEIDLHGEGRELRTLAGD